jgi:predicted RNA-binding Zn-ribbon protein involved in translation (DUF1610 family)
MDNEEIEQELNKSKLNFHSEEFDICPDCGSSKVIVTICNDENCSKCYSYVLICPDCGFENHFEEE